VALLNEADALYLGATEVRRVFVDDEVPWVKAGLPSQSIFGSEAPAGSDLDAGSDYTFGTVFRVTVPGTITHVRVYRAPGATLSDCPIAIYANFNPLSVAYNPSGAFYGPGWNNIPLVTPLAVVPGVDYMAAFFTAQGAYVYTSHRLDSAVSSGNLIAPGSASVGGNGRFKIAPTFTIPEGSFNASWYGVDVAFVPGGTVPATGPAGHLTTSFEPPSARNNFTGEVGVRIGMAATKTFQWLGLRVESGNTGLHQAAVYDFFTLAVISSAMVDMTGATPGTYAWKKVAPFTLTAAGYYVVVAKVVGGDGQNWGEQGPATMDPTLVNNVYVVYRGDNPAWAFDTAAANSQFHGVDLGWD
jgi:hypothetical protein